MASHTLCSALLCYKDKKNKIGKKPTYRTFPQVNIRNDFVSFLREKKKRTNEVLHWIFHFFSFLLFDLEFQCF